TFTQAEIDDHRVEYRETGDVESSDSFIFHATDAAGDHTAATTFNIAIQGSPSTAGATAAAFQDITLPAADWQAQSLAAAAYNGSGMAPLEGTGQAGTWVMIVNHLTDPSSFAASQSNWPQGG